MLVQILLQIIKNNQFFVKANQQVLMVLEIDTQRLVVDFEVGA